MTSINQRITSTLRYVSRGAGLINHTLSNQCDMRLCHSDPVVTFRPPHGGKFALFTIIMGIQIFVTKYSAYLLKTNLRLTRSQTYGFQLASNIAGNGMHLRLHRHLSVNRCQRSSQTLGRLRGDLRDY